LRTPERLGVLQLEQMPPIEIAHGATRKSGLMFKRIDFHRIRRPAGTE
jgi:hypothetical protein